MAEPYSFRHIIKQLIGIADPLCSPYGMDSADAEEAFSAESLWAMPFGDTLIPLVPISILVAFAVWEEME